MFRNILFFFVIYIVVVNVNYSQKYNDDGKYTPLTIFRFYDSSHHWYDITDQDKIIHPLKNRPQYKRNEIEKIADNILLFQKSNGGWPKNYDMLAILSKEQRDSVINSKDILNTTYDNGATHSQLTYLAEVYTVTKEPKYKIAFYKGLDFVFASQYANGGWPQYYPEMKGYAKYITFNDGAMIGVMNLLKDIIDNDTNYSFVDEAYRKKAKEAFNKGLDCILKCQIKEKGKLLAWCQQHDEKNFQPRWARTFEPPSICNGESSGIVDLLMKIDNPNQQIIDAVQGAVRWFKDSEILNTRVETIKAPRTKFIYQTNSIDRVVVHDTTAEPIWTRFYELKTLKPMFCDRGKKIYYSLDKVSRERRSGYSYYTYDPQKVLNMYPAWQEKWVPNTNVLKEN